MPYIVKALLQCVVKTSAYMDAEKQLESFVDEKELLTCCQELINGKDITSNLRIYVGH